MDNEGIETLHLCESHLEALDAIGRRFILVAVRRKYLTRTYAINVRFALVDAVP